MTLSPRTTPTTTLLRRGALACGLVLGAGLAAVAHAEVVGDVDTAFKLIGPDHKIVVEAYDDPKVNGVTCYVSRAKTGGLAGAFGVAEDKSEASIACRQVGPVSVTRPGAGPRRPISPNPASWRRCRTSSARRSTRYSAFPR